MPGEAPDLPALAAVFGRTLRRAGVPVTPERSARFVRALTLAPPRGRGEIYWSARLVFVSARDQIAAFDRVFAAVFDGIADVVERRGEANAPPTPAGVEAGRRPARNPGRTIAAPASAPAPSGAASSDAGAGEKPREALLAAASSAERLRHRDFAELDEEELAALAEIMRRLALTPPQRRSRRARRAAHGERIDLRSTLRRSHRTGGDPIRLLRRRRRLRPRRLVVLCDVSGSMEPYTRAFLQFLHGAVGGADAEAFVFATRLTRLTGELSGNQPGLAIGRAAAAASDWSGGTRIAAALHRFDEDYGRRGMARGAVVAILSDGWERDDPARLGAEMAKLRRLAHRIIWVNPRKASPGFAPLTGGMAAALPFCDALLSGHSLAALEVLVELIGESRRRDGIRELV
ncbi:MAG: VWA domain-containing protein [Solirubrobacterales bacterium]